jgi:hypothetical protein
MLPEISFMRDHIFSVQNISHMRYAS